MQVIRIGFAAWRGPQRLDYAGLEEVVALERDFQKRLKDLG